MKDLFAFFIMFSFGSPFLVSSLDSAVCNAILEEEEAIAFARAHWKNIDNWDGFFVLKDGSVIKHTKGSITHERNWDIIQSLKQGFFIEKRNGNKCHALDFRMPLSRADFLCKLCESELYQKTEEDEEDLAENGNWEAEISVVNLIVNGVECHTVCHKPGEIRLKSMSGESINLSRYYTNEFGYTQYSKHLYCTKRVYLTDKKGGREVYLSANLSRSEFTRILFECGHIIFQSYPPYTIQGEQDGSFTYYYYGDLEKPEWQKVQDVNRAAARAAEILRKKKKKEKKEALKRMWKEKHEEHLLAQQEVRLMISEDQLQLQQRLHTKPKTAPKKWDFNFFNQLRCNWNSRSKIAISN